MKFLGLIIGVFLLIAVFPQGVRAQQAWVESDYCNNATGEYKITRDMIKNSDSGSVTASMIEAKSFKICTTDRSLHIQKIDDPVGWANERYVRYCPVGKAIPYMKLEGEYSSGGCCASGEIGIKGYQGRTLCCPSNTISDADAKCILDNNSRVDPVNSTSFSTVTATTSSSPYKIGASLFTCPADSCLVQGTELLEDNNTANRPFTQAQRDDHKCLPHGTALKGVFQDGVSLSGKFCSYQQAEDPVVLTLVSINPDISSCQEIDDLAERQNCLECFMKNIDPNNPNAPKSYVYSSIGCVDTRQNEFITRLFQIGFGMLGGFGVLRIMWGAILRQSTDPAKIQEGKDLITSSIWALVTLAVTIPLLRFLGINLLQLLPNNFLR